MNKLVVHHTYVNGLAFDVSKNQNHGHPVSVAPGAGAFVNSFHFGGGPSRIVVAPSTSLSNLFSIRTSVRFYLAPIAGWHRFNLIEGHLTFALFVNPDRSLQGTILDANSIWHGATSAPGLVVAGQWHEAQFEHDGVSRCQLSLDGIPVGVAYDVPGPVRSVGPHGIAIGHWPEDPGVYTFEGNLTEVKLYKYDPREDTKRLLDPCCIDRKLLDKAYLHMKQKGWSGHQLEASAWELLGVASKYASAIRHGDPTVTGEQENISTALMSALLRGDSGAYRSAVDLAVQQAHANLAPSDQSALNDEVVKVVEGLPFTIKQLQEFTRALCLQHAVINPDQPAKPQGRKATTAR